jgi:hypothetical protein
MRIIIFLLLLIILIILFSLLSVRENFGLEETQPLQLVRNTIFDPGNWHRLDARHIRTFVTFYAKKGTIDWNHIVAQPEFGWPGYSRGFGNYSWNKVAGTDIWSTWNHSSSDKEWLRWEKVVLEDGKKKNQITLELIVTTDVPNVTFPHSFFLRIPDIYYGNSQRATLIFTQPITDIQDEIPEHAPDAEIYVRHHDAPLLLENAMIQVNNWTHKGGDAWADVIITPDQGRMNTLQGLNNKDDWLSWEILSKTPHEIRLRLRVRQDVAPPKDFPMTRVLTITDLRRIRSVDLTLIIPKNPIVDSILEDKTFVGWKPTSLFATTCRFPPLRHHFRLPK